MPVTIAMTFRRYYHLLLILVFSAFLTSCDILGAGPCLEGTGNTITQQRDLTAFTGVDMRVPGKVYVTYGLTHTISVETFANLQPEILAEIQGSNLVIRSESCLEYNPEEAIIRITLPLLENIELKSSADISIQQVLTNEKLRLILSGSGSINFNGTVNKLNVLHSGSGDILLTGLASELESILSGSGRIQGFPFAANSAKIVLAGSGYQQVWAKENLDVTITGSGNIYYIGTPSINKYTPGRGTLHNNN